MALRALLENIPLFGLLLLAAAIDVRQRRIPNWLTAGMMLAGLSRAALIGGWSGLGHSAAGLFASAAAPFALFALGALGGGDVKLLAGVGAWLGPSAGVAVFAVQCVIGLGLVLFQAMTQRRTILLFRNTALLAATISQQGLAPVRDGGAGSFSTIDRPLPYAVPVALATCVVIFTPVLTTF